MDRLEQLALELEAEAARLEEDATKLRAAADALRTPVREMHFVAVEPPPPPPEAEEAARPTSEPRPGVAPGRALLGRPDITLETVRDVAQRMGDFNVSDLAREIDGDLRRRTKVGRLVDLLTERGTLRREGNEKGGSGVSWHFVKPGEQPRPTMTPAQMLATGSKRRLGPGWKSTAAVPTTGRAMGTTGKPGKDKKLQASGRRIKRSRQGT